MTTLISLLWISFVIVPLKVILYTVLVLVTIPYGQLSLLGNTAVAWIGYEFPPQLALIYTYPVELLMRNTWPLPTNTSRSRSNTHASLRRSSSSSLSLLLNYSSLQMSVLDLSSAVLLVASREISPSSMFYRAVILLLDYNPGVGSRGVIINFDTSSSSSSTASTPSNQSHAHSHSHSFSSLPKIPTMRHGIGGPMETDIITVLHTYSDCARYSEKIEVPSLNLRASNERKEHHSFFVTESQHAYRTLSKIASAVFQKKEQPKIKKLRFEVSNKTSFLNINVREKARALLKPFPFFSKDEEEEKTSSPMQDGTTVNGALESKEDLVNDEFLVPPKRNKNKNQPEHRFFKNPNYRELSVEARGYHSTAEVKFQETILSEVKEQVEEQLRIETHNRTEQSEMSHLTENAWSIDEEEEFLLIEAEENETEKEKENPGIETNFGTNQRVLVIKGNSIWLANQLEGEIMHGFWHVVTSYEFEDIFPVNEEDTRNLWNNMIGRIEEGNQ